MSGARHESRARTRTTGIPRVAWLLVVVALALVAPARGAALERRNGDGVGRAAPTAATSEHAWGAPDTRAAKTDVRHRTAVPGGAPVTAGLSMLLLGAVLVVRRA